MRVITTLTIPIKDPQLEIKYSIKIINIQSFLVNTKIKVIPIPIVDIPNIHILNCQVTLIIQVFTQIKDFLRIIITYNQ